MSGLGVEFGTWMRETAIETGGSDNAVVVLLLLLAPQTWTTQTCHSPSTLPIRTSTSKTQEQGSAGDRVEVVVYYTHSWNLEGKGG